MTTKKVQSRISDYLTGETNGLLQALADFGAAPERYSFGPPAGEVWVCTRIIIHIGDAASMSPSEYGGLAPLTNGYDVKVVDGTGDVLKVLNGMQNFKTNGDLGGVCYDIRNLGVGVSGEDAIDVRWTWERSGSAVRLIGDEGQKIAIDFSDSFVGLTSHTFFVDGQKGEP